MKPGKSAELSFSTTKDTAGNYTIDVNGQSGQFIVKSSSPPPTPKPTTIKSDISDEMPNNLWIIIVASGSILVFSCTLFFLYKRLPK